MVLQNANCWGAGKRYWYWNRRGRSINALDYLVEIRGCSLVDAVNTLTDKREPGGDKCFFIMGKLWK